MDLWSDNWSALSSAAVLMAGLARRTGSELSPAQRARIVWELDKYTPCYVEPAGDVLLERALPAVDEIVDGGDWLAAAREHGGRILRPRDRETLSFAVGAAVRTAAMEREIDAEDVAFVHEAFHRSKGAMAIDGDHGSVELGQQDGARIGSDPGALAEILQRADPADTERDVRWLAEQPMFPSEWTRQKAFAFLLETALRVDRPDGPPSDLEKLRAAFGQQAPAEGITDSALSDEDQSAGLAAYEAGHPDRRFVFLRFYEDNLAFFLDRSKSVQGLLLRILNAIVAAGPITPYRRELITMAMAVLAQGRLAEWRERAAPPMA